MDPTGYYCRQFSLSELEIILTDCRTRMMAEPIVQWLETGSAAQQVTAIRSEIARRNIEARAQAQR